MNSFSTRYRTALYLTAGSLLALNIPALILGNLAALISLGAHGSALVATYTRKSWSYLVVMAWSLIGIVTGGAMWVAILLRGGVITQPASAMIFRTFLLVSGVFFFMYARRAVSPEAAGET